MLKIILSYYDEESWERGDNSVPAVQPPGGGLIFVHRVSGALSAF